MKKVLDVFKKPLWLLCLGLGIVLFASIFANMANTSMYSVSVTNVKFETERGEMAGILYRPRSCTADNPCATIVTTHGYLNTGEMQDAPAIELSKRGYVVLAMDQYDHGDSTWDTAENGSFMFWIYSQYDAVQWIYDQDYVLKAEDGTGMIAVSGHSMGGFSSRMAAFLDSTDGGVQKVSAVLAVGADFQWTSTFGFGTDTIIGLDVAAGRTMGTIAAKYDEFFFNADNNKGGTVKRKDYTTTTEGNKFYWAEGYTTNKEFNSGEWNDEAYNGGGSVIYVPNEIHPWNHFSTETTAYMVDFYTKAFKTQIEKHEVTENLGVVSYEEGKLQSWWLKEGFECIGLVGMFIAIVAAIGLFAKLPFFGKVVTEEGEINEVSAPTGARKWAMLGFLVVSCFATAYVFPMICLGTTEAFENSLTGIMWACAIILILGVVAKCVVKAVSASDEEKVDKSFSTLLVGAAAIFVAAFFSYWTLTKPFFTNSNFYNEPTTNEIAYWILVVSGLTFVALTISYFVSNKKDGYTLANYGLKANWKQILIALLIALIVVTGVYVITFVIEYLLVVDFRVWAYALKPFNKHSFVAFLKYLPVYFLFFFTVGLNVVANTGSDRSWKGTLKAVLISALPSLLLVCTHYGYDFITGTAKWPTVALSMILVIVIPITMGVAAWFFRKSWQKTNNIWTGVFICTLLFTMIQVANTTLYIMQ